MALTHGVMRQVPQHGGCQNITPVTPLQHELLELPYIV
jgi:hypothetical protein